MKFSTETDRLEAFTDGVLAVIITVMVLELRPPQGTELRSLLPSAPTIATYALSFVLVAIYWNNHHHMLRASRGVDGRAMWANFHLLFWLSLVPFSTAWLGQHPTAVGPTVFYTLILLFCSLAYAILQRSLRRVNGASEPFGKAIETDVKGLMPLVLYVIAIGAAFLSTFIADAVLVGVAAVWFYPDTRFEPLINMNKPKESLDA